MFSEKQASCSNKSCRQQLFSSYKPIPSRQYIAWSGPSTRLVSADNSISDGPQHICRRGRFIPDAIIYSLHADGWFTWEMFTRLHCPLLGLCNCKYIMPEFAGYYKFLFFPYLCIYACFGTDVVRFPDRTTRKKSGLFREPPWWKEEWYHQESNRGHKDFQSFALPTELWHHLSAIFFSVC